MTDRVVSIGVIGASFTRPTQIPGFKHCTAARIVAIVNTPRPPVSDYSGYRLRGEGRESVPLS